MSTTQTFTGTLAIIECCNCHTHFGITQAMKTALVETANTFYCPAGHPQHFTESEATRLKRQISQLTARNDQLDAAVQRERERTAAAYKREERQRRCTIAQKAAKTRLKNRVMNGVCPCCNRSFLNLQRHMKTQHPEAITAIDKSDKLTAKTDRLNAASKAACKAG